mmetsp:Transcript_12055/g.18230  ORF Transcript_12055/g.18230 Transcript_12055/m.18230 type:complete len:93 (+) Transcript_12055:167-445(+)
MGSKRKRGAQRVVHTTRHHCRNITVRGEPWLPLGRKGRETTTTDNSKYLTVRKMSRSVEGGKGGQPLANYCFAVQPRRRLVQAFREIASAQK